MQTYVQDPLQYICTLIKYHANTSMYQNGFSRPCMYLHSNYKSQQFKLYSTKHWTISKVVVMLLQIATVSTLVWVTHLVVAQEKVCSSFCSSLGMMRSNPGKSCNDIYQTNKATRGKSDHYWINTTTGVHQVFCDMELECGGHKGGWMRITDLDTSRGDSCPTGWTKFTTPSHQGRPAIDVCRSPNGAAGCHSASFTINGTSFHKICGRVRGYGNGSPDGFATSGNSINGIYADGISITLGNPRKHVWTYVAGYADDTTGRAGNCPCAAGPGHAADSFVRDHYYCEAGGTAALSGIYYLDDPLWDGSGCVQANNNCCTDVGMPWFYRQFPAAQEDDVEVRLCTDEAVNNEAVVVDQLQLFVQ